MPACIRLIDLGLATPEQTQANFHAVAERMTIDTPDTIILCRPTLPYVSLGYHQVCDMVLDRAACERLHLPIFRRRVGGGATFLDSNQLFYQCIFHRSRVPSVSSAIFATLLQAPVATLRRLGLNARLDQTNEIEVDGKRIAGTGGGQIEEACVVVGNILFDFDYETMARVWRVPSESFRELALLAMRAHITTLQQLLDSVEIDAVQALLIEEFTLSLERPLEVGELMQAEIQHSRELGQRLQSPEFLELYGDEEQAEGKPLKIAAGVFIHADQFVLDGVEIRGSFRVHHDRIEDARLEPAPWSALEGQLRGILFKEWRSAIANYSRS